MRVPRMMWQVAALTCSALIAAGCAKKESAPATDSAAGALAPAPAPMPTTTPAPIAVADLAGKWNIVAVPTTGDTTPTTSVLEITAPDQWTQHFSNGQVVKAKIVLAGDSVVTDAGPYPSVRRKGVKVTTHGVVRKQGDKLVGTTVAHYQVKTADSVVTLRVEGTRAP